VVVAAGSVDATARCNDRRCGRKPISRQRFLPQRVRPEHRRGTQTAGARAPTVKKRTKRTVVAELSSA
jgi:hypothetical protein